MRGDPERLLSALDPEQQQVARALTGPVVVIAGAGTGKTRAITHRIAYGAAVGAYQPRNVLALTFTTRAAGELRSRLADLGAPGVQARTFHSAALRQAQYFWPRIHGGELPPIMSNRFRMVAEVAGRLGLDTDTALIRDLISEISWSKVNNADPERYAALARAHRRQVASAEPEVVARVFTAYEEAKRDAARIDFDDILLCTASLLADHEEVAAEFRRNYRHLVVDEYQDTSPLQQRLVDLWRGPSEELCVVGDPAQTIHSFAGARAEYLTDFTRRHPNATVVRLNRDYRSSPQVVHVANTLQKFGRGGLGGVELISQRPAGPSPVFVEAPDEAAEANAVAHWLHQRHASGVELREMAVLFRTNAQSPLLEQALSDRGLSYVVRGGERFYDRAEVRQGLAALRSEARSGAVLDDGRDITDPSERAVAVLRAIGWQAEAPSGSGAVRERWESLAALAAAVADLAKADPEADFALLIGRLEDRAADQHVPQAHGVTLGTLHSAKGLEWDAVALVGVHEGSLPFVLAQSQAQIAEERRLLYVGVTRARRDLWISWSVTRNGGGRRRSPSRFLEGIRPDSARTAGAGANRKSRERRRGSALSATCRVCGQRLTDAAERKIGRCGQCPGSYDENTLALLKEWRRQEAQELRQPAYCVFTDATLMAIAEAVPTDQQQLLRIKGIGAAKAEKYGEMVLTLLSAGSLPGADA